MTVVDAFLDSLKKEAADVDAWLADLKSGLITHGEFRDGIQVDTTAEEIADNERRKSALDAVLTSWGFNAPRT